MEQKSVKELEILFQEAIRAGGAPLEMRVRRFVSLLRGSDPQLAQALSSSLKGSALRRTQLEPSPIDQDSRLQLVRETYPVVLDQELVLAEAAHAAVQTLVRERLAADALVAAGLLPMRSLLLCGPPGVGKSMTAAWIAQQLDLPLLTLDLASVMSSYLGRTGSNVKAVLDHAQSRPCVLLLDEFDAIAKRRNDEGDVGELKRLVTVLLQAIDDWSTVSILIAATNHGELLDRAVWRRFDLTVDLGLPEFEERRALLTHHGISAKLASVVAGVTEGVSQALLHRAALGARKAPLISGTSVEESLLQWAVQQKTKPKSRSTDKGERDLHIFLQHFRGHSARDIADNLQISHTTVNRTLSLLKGSDG